MKSTIIICCALFALLNFDGATGAERVGRQLGGVKRLNGEELVRAQGELTQSLNKLAAGDGPSYTIDTIYSGTTQTVAGKLNKLDVDLIDGQNGESIRCLVSVWSRPWLKQDGYEVTFKCNGKETVTQRHSR